MVAKKPHKHVWRPAGTSGGGIPVRRCSCGKREWRAGVGGRWVTVVGPVSANDREAV